MSIQENVLLCSSILRVKFFTKRKFSKTLLYFLTCICLLKQYCLFLFIFCKFYNIINLFVLLQTCFKFNKILKIVFKFIWLVVDLQRQHTSQNTTVLQYYQGKSSNFLTAYNFTILADTGKPHSFKINRTMCIILDQKVFVFNKPLIRIMLIITKDQELSCSLKFVQNVTNEMRFNLLQCMYYHKILSVYILFKQIIS